MAAIPAVLKPPWLRTYATVILAVSMAVNLITSFSLYVQALTIPGMKLAFSLTYTQAFVLVAALSLSRVVSGLVSGILASRYGGRWLIIVSLMSSTLAMWLLGWSPNYWVAMAAMIVVGFSSGSALTPMMGMLSPWFRATDRGIAAGLAAAGGSLAIVVIGLMFPPLTRFFGEDAWRFAWYILGGCSLLIGLACMGFIREAPSTPTPVARTTQAVTRPPVRGSRWPIAVYTNRAIWHITAIAFCSGCVQGVLTSSFGSYLETEHGVHVSTVGILFMVIGVLSITSGIVPGGLSDRWGRGMAFGVTFLIQGASHALFWLVPEVPSFVIASILTGLIMRATYTLCAASAGDYVPVYMAPAAFGLMGMGAGIGSTLSPVITGPIADATNTLQWSFAMSTGMALAGALLGFVLYFNSRRTATTPPDPTAAPATV